jgi:hypothetical protein
VFRGAWLDHRVKAGLLDVAFDEASGGFAYRMPSDQSPLVELARCRRGPSCVHDG